LITVSQCNVVVACSDAKRMDYTKPIHGCYNVVPLPNGMARIVFVNLLGTFYDFDPSEILPIALARVIIRLRQAKVIWP
jgi:hypothetical protein